MDFRLLGPRLRRRSRPLVRSVRGMAQVEVLEPRALLASNPTATLNASPDPFIGASLNFTVTFSNPSGAGVTPGYTPFLDVVLPTTAPTATTESPSIRPRTWA